MISSFLHSPDNKKKLHQKNKYHNNHSIKKE
jgi:hypothetical protein